MHNRSSEKPQTAKQNDDREIMVIRSLVAQEKLNAAEAAREQLRKEPGRPHSKAHQLPPLSNAKTKKPYQKGLVGHTVDLGACGVDAVKSYRPQSKLILRTSLILLLLLQPIFILGSMLVTVLLTFACYFYVGSERFWKKVIGSYRAFAKRKPAAARAVKLRAYVISRRWDAIVSKLPEQVAEAWRSPDLRGLLRAEEQHARAMNDRLNRLV